MRSGERACWSNSAFDLIEELHGAFAGAPRKFGPERNRAIDGGRTGRQVVGHPGQARFDGRQDGAKIVRIPDYEIEDGIHRRIAVDLRVVAPSLKISFVQQFGAKHRQEGPPVQPVVAAKRGFRQLFGRGERALGQANLGAAGRDIIFAEARVELVQAKTAGRLGKSLVGLFKKPIDEAPECANVCVVGRGKKSACGGDAHCEGVGTILPSLSTGPSAMASALLARSRIFFTSASVGVRPSASAARSRRLLIRR